MRRDSNPRDPFPGLRCCTLPFAFRASLISEISRWRSITSAALEKNSFRWPWLHFLKAFQLRSWLFRWVSGSWFRRQLGPPAPRPAFEDMAVVEEAVEHGGGGRAVVEESSPVLNRAV